MSLSLNYVCRSQLKMQTKSKQIKQTLTKTKGTQNKKSKQQNIIPIFFFCNLDTKNFISTQFLNSLKLHEYQQWHRTTHITGKTTEEQGAMLNSKKTTQTFKDISTMDHHCVKDVSLTTVN